jgi:hypothetical protein
MSLEEPEKSALKKMLTTPPIKKIDLHFPLGLEVTARNLKGVTIKDALDAIYKQYRKKVCSATQVTFTSPHSPLRFSCAFTTMLIADMCDVNRQTTNSRPQS